MNKPGLSGNGGKALQSRNPFYIFLPLLESNPILQGKLRLLDSFGAINRIIMQRARPQGVIMKRLLPVIMLLLATLARLTPISAGDTIVVDLEGSTVTGPTTPIPSPLPTNAGDSIVFVSNGPSSNWYVQSLSATPENVSVGVGLDGRLFSKNGVDYHDATGFSFMQEATIAGNLVIGNNSSVSASNFIGGTGNLNIGGNIYLGSVDTAGTGSLTVDNTLAFTGSDQTVLFRNASSRLQVKNVLTFANGAKVTVQGGGEGEFEVLKKTTLTNATLQLNGKAMSFYEGVTVGTGGRISALTSGSTLYLGDSTTAVTGTLTLAGGVLDGSTGQLVINPKSTLGVKAAASIAVTADSTIMGEVSSHDLDATISAAATVHNEANRGTWTIKNGEIQNGGSLVLGVARDPALGGNRNGIVRITDAGLTVRQGGKIETAAYQMYKNADTTWNAVSILSNTNIIGSGRTGGGAVALTMDAGSTLDLTKGNLFLDNVTANINGSIIFGGMDSGGANQTPFALVGTNYQTDNAGNATYLGSVGTITLGAGSSIVLNNDFASTFVNNSAPDEATSYNTLIDVSGNYLGQQVGAMGGGLLQIDSSLYGDNNVMDLGLLGRFTFAVDATGKKLYISKVERDFLLDGSQEGLDAMRKVVTDKYGPLLGKSDVAINIYRYASTADPNDPGGLGRLVKDPTESAAYEVTSAYFDAVLRGTLASGDTSAANLYTGANVGRTITAAMDSMTVLHSGNIRHANDKRQQLMTVAEFVGGDEALAARIIEEDRQNRVWAAPFGQTASGEKRKGFEGYDYDALGLTIGYDRVFGSFIGGGSLSYIYGDYEDKSSLESRSRINNYAASLYGTVMLGDGFYLTGSGSYMYGDHDMKELRRNYAPNGQPNDMWNTANYGIHTWQAAIELGYDFKPSDKLTITPSAGFNYIHAKAENHHEAWGGTAIGRYTGMTARGKILPVRVDLDYKFYDECETVVALTATAGFMHNLSDDKIDGTIYLNGFNNATPMSAYSRNSGRNTVTAGLGLRVNKGSADFNLNYDYLHRSQYDNHQLQALFGLNF